MLPDDVRAVLASLGVDPVVLEEIRKPGPPRPIRRWWCADVLVDLATSEHGRRLVRLEVEGRAWAAGAGVPVPGVHAADPDGRWMVGARAHGVSCRGPGAVRAALDAADRVAACSAPRPALAPSTWSGDRRTLPARVARSLLGGLPIRRFREARAAARALTDVASGHGDLYRRNVIADQDDISVIDWEFLGPHPRWSDHVRLWSTLTDTADRTLAVGHLEDVVPLSGHPQLAVLVRHLTLRLLAENVAAPPRHRNSADLAHARAMVREGEELARRISG